MVTQQHFLSKNLSHVCLCLALTASSLLFTSTAAALDNSYEITTLKSLAPFITTWRNAITEKNVEAAKKAAEKYEAKWQGLEVYVNHRSLPLYRDMEIDTQFAIEAELEKEQPDFALLANQITHLREDLTAAVQMAKAGPMLSPLFDDLVPLRGLRSKSLYIARTALAATPVDIAKAKSSFLLFKKAFPSVISLIDARSTVASGEVQVALDAASAVFADPNATVEQLNTANATLIERYGFAVSLLNAAARTADLKKLALTDTDKANLTQLNIIKLALVNDVPTAGETGADSDFAVLQPTLESLGRSINIVRTLRTALVAYDNAVKADVLSNADAIKIAKKAALEAVAITQQALVGQFWGSPELQTFLDSLPK